MGAFIGPFGTCSNQHHFKGEQEGVGQSPSLPAVGGKCPCDSETAAGVGREGVRVCSACASGGVAVSCWKGWLKGHLIRVGTVPAAVALRPHFLPAGPSAKNETLNGHYSNRIKATRLERGDSREVTLTV